MRAAFEFETSKSEENRYALGSKQRRPHAGLFEGSKLESRQIGVEVSDGFDAAEIIFEGDVFVGSVRIFIGQTETEKHAGNRSEEHTS